MRMRGLWVVGASALLAACPVGSPPEDPDARPDGSGTGGLTVRFQSDQPVPGDTAPDRRLEEVDLRAYSVRVIGDASPGGEDTTRMDARIRWHDGEAPETIRFESAPPGLYASVEVRLLSDGGEEDAYRIRGEALVEMMWRDFELTGEELATITVPVAANLPPGGSATIDIPVDLAGLIAGIDFAACPLDGEDLDCDAQSAVVDAAVIAAFGDGGGAEAQGLR